MRFGRLALLVPVTAIAVFGAGAVQAQQNQTVSLTNFAFGPAQLTATAGQPVSWTFTNDSTFPHDFRVEIGGQTIDAAPGDTNVAPGERATLATTFTTPGTYEFWCPVGMHRDRGMVGTLTVVAAGAAAPAAQPKPGMAAPSQMPGTLPRTGALPISPAELLAGVGGAASLATGLFLRARRRRD